MAINPVPTNGMAASNAISESSRGGAAIKGYMNARTIAQRGKPTAAEGISTRATPQSGNVTARNKQFDNARAILSQKKPNPNKIRTMNDQNMRKPKGKGQNTTFQRQFSNSVGNKPNPPTTQGRTADFLTNFNKPNIGANPRAGTVGAPTPATTRPPDVPNAGIDPRNRPKPPMPASTRPPDVPNPGIDPRNRPKPPMPALGGPPTGKPVATSRPPITGGPVTTPPISAAPGNTRPPATTRPPDVPNAGVAPASRPVTPAPLAKPATVKPIGSIGGPPRQTA